MKQEDKDLLLKDLCARLPYGVKAKVRVRNKEKVEVEVPLKIYSINTDGYLYFETKDCEIDYLDVNNCRIKNCSLYLRPMTSMTEEERKELYGLLLNIERLSFADIIMLGKDTISPAYDWLNKHHFDYRSLIEKGLALEASEGMYRKEKQK